MYVFVCLHVLLLGFVGGALSRLVQHLHLECGPLCSWYKIFMGLSVCMCEWLIDVLECVLDVCVRVII